jgi:hypothetical protein
MINNKIIDVVLKNAPVDNANKIIKELLKHLDNGYDYNDNKKNHILEMLVDLNSIITVDKVNIEYIIENFDTFMYYGDKYNYRNIKVENVDNIDCVIKVSYEYMEKINEDRADIDWNSSTYNIDFIDRPELLKKS